MNTRKDNQNLSSNKTILGEQPKQMDPIYESSPNILPPQPI